MEDQKPRDADEGDELEAEIMQADHAEERPDRPSIDVALSVVDEGPSDDEEELVADAVIERDEFAEPEEYTRCRGSANDLPVVLRDEHRRAALLHLVRFAAG